MSTMAWVGCSSGSDGKANPDARHADGGADAREAGSAGGSGGGGVSDGGDAQAGAGGAAADATSETGDSGGAAADAASETGDSGGVAAETGSSGDARDAPSDAAAVVDSLAAPEAGADSAGNDGGSGQLVVVAPSFSVPANTESTQCVVLDFGNAQPVHIGAIKSTINSVVYELRIGAVSGTAQTIPSPCTPFGDLND